jgi:glycine/D-amino acid oxidase-like deaminating enzyme
MKEAFAMVDVTVFGAGIFGLSIAWVCARRGARVRVVDPFGPGAGSSGGLVGALAPHVPENWNQKKAFQFDSLMMAAAFWTDVEATGGVSAGYGRTGRLQPIADARALELAHARAKTAATLWQGQAQWQVLATNTLGPWMPPSPTGYVIRDSLSARLHPRRACQALVAGLATLGVDVVKDAAAKGAVVEATGAAGLKALGINAGRNVGVGIKGQAALLRYDAGPGVPQLFADTVHIVPHADGTLAVGSTTERDYDDPTSTDTALDDVIARATAALPVLHGAEVIERWAGLRPRARTRAPILGADPNRPGVYIANGGFKIGFGMAPKIAQVMADLILDGQDNIPDDFRVDAVL